MEGVSRIFNRTSLQLDIVCSVNSESAQSSLKRHYITAYYSRCIIFKLVLSATLHYYKRKNKTKPEPIRFTVTWHAADRSDVGWQPGCRSDSLPASNPSDVSAAPNTRHLLSSNHRRGNILTSYGSFRAESSVPVMHRFSYLFICFLLHSCALCRNILSSCQQLDWKDKGTLHLSSDWD